MMVKKGDAKTGKVVASASAKEAVVCTCCGKVIFPDSKCDCESKEKECSE